jgi:hypothetical protein
VSYIMDKLSPFNIMTYFVVLHFKTVLYFQNMFSKTDVSQYYFLFHMLQTETASVV